MPYIGFARNDIMAGKINRAMIIGKGSLFLGRMTNLFDGVSFVIEANKGEKAEAGVSEDEVKEHDSQGHAANLPPPSWGRMSKAGAQHGQH